jgi:hypothetical protein
MHSTPRAQLKQLNVHDNCFVIPSFRYAIWPSTCFYAWVMNKYFSHEDIYGFIIGVIITNFM